jgi:hypothetical protein
VVVIGGLFSSTALTLLVVPVLYRWFEPKGAGAPEAPEFAVAVSASETARPPIGLAPTPIAAGV